MNPLHLLEEHNRNLDNMLELMDDFITAKPTVEMMVYYQKKFKQAAFLLLDAEKSIVGDYDEDAD